MRLITLLYVLTITSCSTMNFAGHHEKELAPYMASLQRFSQKLGFSIEHKNQRLAKFYLEELEEALEEVKHEIPEHDGFPVSRSIQVIMEPELKKLAAVLEKPSWPEIRKKYAAVINGCNRCHAALEHEFIVITPVAKSTPFNQLFTPPSTERRGED